MRLSLNRRRGQKLVVEVSEVFVRGSVPHVRHAAMAVIRPSADPGPSVSRVL